MPNWCYNKIQIQGPSNEIDRIERTELNFERILPTPSDLLLDEVDEWNGLRLSEFIKQSNLATYGHEDWYGWRMEHWGTKWNPGKEHRQLTRDLPTKIMATLITASLPPINILEKLSAENPNSIIHITDCVEEFGFFVGSVKIHGGKVTESTLHEPNKSELIEHGIYMEEDD